MKRIFVNTLVVIITFELMAGMFYSQNSYNMPAGAMNSQNYLSVQGTQSNSSRHYHDHVTRNPDGTYTTSGQQSSPGCGCPINVTLSGATQMGNALVKWGIAWQNGQPIASVNITFPLGGSSSGNSGTSQSS